MTADVRQQYREDFQLAASSQLGAAIPWLRSMRTQALEQFMDTGFPTLKHEDWKYTDVRPIGARHFAPAAAAGTVTVEQLRGFDVGGHALVFVDGR